MNNRIDQLARAAGFKHPDHVGLSEEYAYFDHVRFAELIVQECIDIVSPYAVRMENFDGGHPIADLKKHFGVEV